MTLQQKLKAFNPTLERLDLDNSHVIAWKWHVQETRGHQWQHKRVCWIDGY